MAVLLKLADKSPGVQFDHHPSQAGEFQRGHEVFQDLLANILQRQLQLCAAFNFIHAMDVLKPSLQVARDCVDEFLLFR